MRAQVFKKSVIKKRKVMAVLLAAVSALFAFVYFHAVTSHGFSSGSGTPEDPYIITTCSELQEIDDQVEYLYASYELGNDIDCSGVSPFETIGNYQQFNGNFLPFAGRFDGQGHTISNVTVGDTGTSFNGIFAELYGASVRNLVLDNITVDGTSYIGALAGRADHSAIIGVSLRNSDITAHSNTPGIVGGLVGRTVTSYLYGVSVVDTTVDATGSSTATTFRTFGGIVGNHHGFSVIERSYSNATVTAEFAGVGGMVGSIQYGSVIIDSYSDATVTGYRSVGGISGGYVTSGISSYISRVYSNASTTAVFTGSGNWAGGINGGRSGFSSALVNISDSFAVGPVSAGTNSGGISGVTPAPLNSFFNNVWYPTGTGQSVCGGGGGSYTAAQCTSVDTDTYYNSSSNAPMSSWNFTDIWEEVPSDRPDLRVFPYTEPTASTTISTCSDLASNVRANPVGWYTLTNDIDCLGDASLLPLTGTNATTSGFYGTLDGAGYTISGITLSKGWFDQYQWGLGLFNRISGATIRDLELAGGGVTATYFEVDRVGALAGNGMSAWVQNVTSTVPVTVGEQFGGGLIGFGSGVFENIHVNADIDSVDAAPYWLGGIIGDAYVVQMDNSSYDGNIISYWYTGGFAGYADLLLLTNSTSTGLIVGSVDVGGFVGYLGDDNGFNATSTLSNVYSGMTMRPNIGVDGYFEGIGGILGDARKFSITDSEYSGLIDIASSSNNAYYIGGIVGDADNSFGLPISEINNTYVDVTITADGVNATGPFVDSIGGVVGYGGNLAISSTNASTTIRLGSDPSTNHINGFQYVGGFFGRLNATTDIDDVSAEGSIEIYEDTTGAFGYALGGFGGTAVVTDINNATTTVDVYLKSYEPGSLSNYVGEFDTSTSINVAIEGDLTINAASNPYWIGGIFGYGSDSSILNNVVTGDITVSNSLAPYTIGGAFGYTSFINASSTNTDHTITLNIGADTSTAGTYGIGGFAGRLVNSNILTDTYVSSTIAINSSLVGGTGATGVGGYAGRISSTNNSITDSYTRGSLTISTGATTPFVNVGGFIGESQNDTNTYTDTFSAISIPAIASSTNVGGYIGSYNGGETFSSNHFDATVTGRSLCSGIDGADPAWCNVQNVASSEPLYFFDSTNAPMTTWDFASTWIERTADYPIFGAGIVGSSSPSVSTVAPATGITTSSATTSGNITSLGTSAVTSRGVVFGTTPLLGATSSESSVGFSTGLFNRVLSGLVCNTTYYYAAFALSADGTSYGSTENFTTAACSTTPPTVTTGATPATVTKTSAEVTGNISALGSGTVTSRGFAYGTTASLGATTSESSVGFSTGIYSIALTGLSCGTTYYVAAFASGSDGIGYGSQQVFSTESCTPSSSGTRTRGVSRGDVNTDVLGRSDSITICHMKGNEKYVLLENVQVFIELADSGLVANLRGHDGHVDDIVPAFTYDFGEGIRTYPGNNWNNETRVLHANNCALFLSQETEEETPEAPTLPTQPEALEEPLQTCDSESQYLKSVAGYDNETTITVVAPTNAISSPVANTRGVKNYAVSLTIKKQNKKESQAYIDKFNGLLEKVKEKNAFNEPIGLIKKTQQNSSFVSPVAVQTSEATEAPISSVITVTEQSPCNVSEDDIVLPETPEESSGAETTTDIPASSPDEFSPQEEASEPVLTNLTEEPAVIISDSLTETDITDWVEEGDLEEFIEPFEIIVTDPYGNVIEILDNALTVELDSPSLEGVTNDDVVVLQPTVDGVSWYVVDHEVENGTLTLTVKNPGKVFVWLKPKKAEAAELLPSSITDLAEPFVLAVPAWLAQAVAGVGLFGGLYVLLSQVNNVPVSTTNARHLLPKTWQNFIALLSRRKRRQPWGTVYDSVTKAPLDPAYVELFTEQGEKVKDAITDLDGRYGFVVPEGTYVMKVNKSNYSFPSRRQTISNRDVIYSHLYYGGPTMVSGSVAHDIPMDAVNFDWNQYEKLRTKQTRFYNRLDPLFMRALDVIFVLGFFFTIWQFVEAQSLVTGIILVVYTVMLAARFFSGKPPLYGFVTRDGRPIPNVLVTVLSGETTIQQKVADNYGRYAMLVSPGTYTVRIEEQVSESEYRTLYEEKIKARKGIINANIRL